MSNDIKNSKIYMQHIKNVKESDIEHVEDFLFQMSDPIFKLLGEIKSLATDDSGFTSIVEALDKSMSPEEMKRWQEKN